MGMTEYDIMQEKRAALYAEQHQVSMRTARKAIERRSNNSKRTASLKIKRT